MTHARDEEQIAETFLREYDLDPRPFPEEEREQGKTPDFRVFGRGTLAFFCEVKSTRDTLLDTLADSPGGKIVANFAPDSTFNRIAGHIHKAVKQFDAVNPDQGYPNVLIFVNHDQGSGFDDLYSTLTGNFVADDGSRDPIYRNVSEGRIRESKRRVHLYWWVDQWDGRRQSFLNSGHQAHAAVLSELFRLDPR